MKIAFVYPNTQKKESQGAGLIASAVLDAGYTLDFYDEAYTPLTDELARQVGKTYDVILLSALTLNFRAAIKFARRAKEANPNVVTLLGGIHATVESRDVLEHILCFDYICVGEGEEFVVEFLIALEGGDVRDVPGLGYCNDDGEVVINPGLACQELDDLPRYRRELFRDESVVHNYPFPGFVYVHASRGCPYRCSYCANQNYLDLYGKAYLRTRSQDAVIDELRWIKARYPVEFFYFGDEMLLANRHYCEELFPRIKSEIGLPYGCMARVEQVTPELVALLRDTGCGYVAMGVECGDETFRREMLNRRMTNERIVEAFRLLRDRPGIDLRAFCMRGWPVPYDDELTAKTLALVEQLKPTRYQMNTFFPFPGTKIYDYCVQQDLIDWDKYWTKRNLKGESVLKPFKE
tara:strand:- start:713 stop:1933 length:1221 start_codon:yes stop_codon:yes gene_type:complete